jgi:hypothetical protein
LHFGLKDGIGVVQDGVDGVRSAAIAGQLQAGRSLADCSPLEKAFGGRTAALATVAETSRRPAVAVDSENPPI